MFHLALRLVKWITLLNRAFRKKGNKVQIVTKCMNLKTESLEAYSYGPEYNLHSWALWKKCFRWHCQDGFRHKFVILYIGASLKAHRDKKKIVILTDILAWEQKEKKKERREKRELTYDKTVKCEKKNKVPCDTARMISDIVLWFYRLGEVQKHAEI